MNASMIASRLLAAHGGDIYTARTAAQRTASRSKLERTWTLFQDVAYHINLLGEGIPS